MRLGNYILDENHNPVEASAMEWAKWMTTSRNGISPRRVAQDDLPGGGFISTVFLGIDHQFGHGPPLLFETMAFGPSSDPERLGDELCQERYSTWAEAEAGHAVILERLRAGTAVQS